MTWLHTYPILVPFVVMIAADVVKFLVDWAKKRDTRRIASTGGMPSSHSAFVSALVVVVAYREGLDSTMFMIAAVIALIVMYDAIYLRNEAGKHATAINLHHDAELEESLGHNHLQVIVGALFGTVMAFGLLII